MKKTITAVFLILVLCLTGGIACRSALRAVYPHKYEDSVEKYSAQYGVDKNLIYAVICTESSFRTDASSEVGAAGLMQIMPETFEWLCMRMGEDAEFYELYDPDTAIRFGTYLLHLLTEEFGDVRTVLAAYHAGRGQVARWLGDASVSPDGKTLAKIPYSDTAHYVRKVERAISMYQNLYA
ncbi:MAG: lytic transglycosylase domain-containing protein [Clostridia bacterium]|nr:lytic transglycosylase domain-containing protein [Clostridia bacterium]